MSQLDNTYYLSSVGYAAVPTRLPNQAIPVGMIVRQTGLPVAGQERCYVCIVAGTANAVTDPPWTFGRGDLVVDGTATWVECTGVSALNGDAVNTLTWNQAVAIGTFYHICGQVIKRNNGASYQINKTGSFGVLQGAEPAFSDTAGVTATDSNGCIWVSLGPVSNYANARAPHALLRSALSTGYWFNYSYPGGTLYVADDHNEMSTVDPGYGGYTGGFTNGQYATNRIISYDHLITSNPPTAADVKAGATVSTSASFSFGTTTGFHISGLTIRAGVGSSSAANISFGYGNTLHQMQNCSLRLNSTAASQIAIGGGSVSMAAVNFDNVTTRFNNVTDYISLSQVDLLWKNTPAILVSGSAVPDIFLRPSYTGVVVVEGCDLSQLTGAIYSGAGAPCGRALVKDCKLNAAATIAPAMFSGNALSTIQTVRCDAGAAAYRSDRYSQGGAETTETSIVRANAVADPTGQKQSRKIVVTPYGATWLRPFLAEPYAIWNSIVNTNVIATVYGLINAAAVPNNDDIWIEFEYMKSGVLGGFVHTTKANSLAAGVPVSSDNSAWANAATVVMPGAWDPATALTVALSNGNLTGTSNGGSSTHGMRVAPALAQDSGKWYFEVTVVTTTGGGNTGIGVATQTAAYSGLGTNGAGGAEVYQAGSVYANGGNQGIAMGAFTNGLVVCVAVDLDNRRIWFRYGASGLWNANAAYSPVTNIGGVPLLAGLLAPACTFSASGNVFTANFGASSFVGAPPAGFASGWTFTNSYTPFKLVAALVSPQPNAAGYIHARVRVAKPLIPFYIDPQIVLSLA